ncbi:MAG: hypothetical protein SGJ18_00740 [Pseudomonadota bacterium]|nr:hypothetical protein [Pseudomonadota bacterium]
MKNIFAIFSLVGMLAHSQALHAEIVWYPLPPEAYSFGKKYPDAQRLLFAFDYGHALVYERLLADRGNIKDPAKLEKEILSQIMVILKNPPNIKVDESDIAPNYVFTFPLTVSLFDWSHMLHQFVLDVMATTKDRRTVPKRIEELLEKYHSNTRVAITGACKTMDFMDGHYFSKTFRQTFPSFNLLIWSYHWFQIKLYEALMEQTEEDRDDEVKKVVAQFWKLLSDLPKSAPFEMMPMTAMEAPMFAIAFPNIPGAFDNNHMLHDIVSDILVSDKVASDKIRGEGFRMARVAQDPEAYKSEMCGRHH